MQKKQKRPIAEKEPVAVSPAGDILKVSYCRKCMKTKKLSEFYQATDLYLDTNGYMSVCKECMEEMYVKAYQSERDINFAVRRVCRSLNIVYNQLAIGAMQKDIDTRSAKGKTVENDFGIYMRYFRLPKFHSGNKDFTYTEPISLVAKNAMSDDDVDGAEKLKDFWGDYLSFDDIAFLEKEYAKIIATYKCDTYAEETLYKEICFTQLQIDKARRNGEPTKDLTGYLQSTLKNAAIDPIKVNAANSGKMQETFGMRIKLIEEKEPCEVYTDPNLFKDYFNMGKYFKNYVLRPLKNFVLGSKDFNITDETYEDEPEELKELDEAYGEGDGEENGNITEAVSE